MRVTAQVVGTTQSKTVDVTVSAPSTGTVPAVPAGYALVENQTLSSLSLQNAGSVKKAYRNCTFTGGVTIRGSRDVWFDQCRMVGFYMYDATANIAVYRSDIKGPGNNDGMHVWVTKPSATTPNNILFQDCLVHDVVKGDPSDHPDGLQVGGVDGLTLRRCEFKKIDVQPIFVNGWVAVCTNILVEECVVWQPTPTGFYSVIIGSGESGFRTTNALVKNCRVGASVLIAQDNGATSAASRNCRQEGTVNDPSLVTR